MDVKAYIQALGAAARTAAAELARAGTAQKNAALLATRDALAESRATVLDANARDLERGREQGLSAALLERLELTPARLDSMLEGLEQVAALSDPVGRITALNVVPSGIQVGRMRVPLGVIAIIYESRPNVTVEAASLCLKAGNAAILRGGSEAFESNQAIAACLARGLQQADLPAAAVQVVALTDRAAVTALITMPEAVDVIVPRGGKSLTEHISSTASVPVIKHLEGVCHVYLDSAADEAKALAIAVNAKTQRYGTCNTMETLLLAEEVAATMLPPLGQAYRAASVELRGCEQTCAVLADARAAAADDWGREYLGPILAVKVVPDVAAAIAHINRHGSGHTDAIVTENYSTALRFLREVDSSSVLINASTRFADGFEYGLGAEIGISTDKLHARGPVGLEGLTSQKYVVFGNGHIRQ